MKKYEHLSMRWKTHVKQCIFYCCLFLCLGLVPLEGYGSEIRLTLKMDNVTLKQVFNEINRKTGFEFVYSSTILEKEGKVSVDASNESLEKVLDLCLAKTALGYKVEDKHIVISSQFREEDPKKTVTYSGVVKDKDGNALPGVTILLEGTTAGVVSDVNGKFSIPVPESAKTRLVFSFVGMKKKVVAVKDTQPLEIVMEEDVTAIDEVVVTGIFNKPKESFTGAAVKVTREELQTAGNRNILQSLSNIDPSFVLVENNALGSNPNVLPEIRIRGVSSIPTVDELQNSTRAELCTPLFILDDFEISLEQVMDLNNDEIESITLLKDASSTAMYGSRGANGVVVIKSVEPQAGKLKVSYNGNLNLEIPSLSSYNLLDAEGKLQLELEAGLYDNSDPAMDAELKELYAKKYSRVLAGVNTNWLRIPVRVGTGQRHYLSVNGGDRSFRYSMGLSYNQIIGAMKGSDRSTLNGTLRLQYLTDKFSFNNNMSLGINKSNNGAWGSFANYASMNPYYEPYDEEGHVVKEFEPENTSSFPTLTNPLWNASLNSFDRSEYTSVINNFSVNYKPVKTIQATLNFSYMRSFSTSENFTSPQASAYFTTTDVLKKGERGYRNSETENWSLSATVNYYNTWDKHVLTAGVNYSVRQNDTEDRGINVLGFVNEAMNDLVNSNAYKGERPSSSDSRSRGIGLAGTVNYNYDNRYFVDLSYRMDGSSSFGSNSRWAPFYSLGCGWNINREPFVMDHWAWLTLFRIKYSFGASGS